MMGLNAIREETFFMTSLCCIYYDHDVLPLINVTFMEQKARDGENVSRFFSENVQPSIID